VLGRWSLPERVSVIDTASSQRGEAQWEAGGDSAAWPDNLAPRPDGTYLIVAGDRPARRITLRVLAKLPADNDLLTELHELGCKQQFEAWVREGVATSRWYFPPDRLVRQCESLVGGS
jgi:hypothetical protein